MAHTLLRSAFLAACGLAVVGCQQAPQLEISSPTRLVDEVQSFLQQAPRPDSEIVLTAAASVAKAYEHPAQIASLPPFDAVKGLQPEELPSFAARHLDPEAELPVAPTFPSYSLSQRLLGTYRLELDQIEARKERALREMLATVDAFPIRDFALIPPSDDMPLTEDRARFVIEIGNTSPLSAYSPTVHVHISVPGELNPRLNTEFSIAQLDQPIDPGTSRRLAFSCCSLTEDPVRNHALRTLPANAVFEVRLVAIKDHKKRELFDPRTYSMAHEARREQLGRCIAHLEADLSAYVPYAAGDPCHDTSGIAVATTESTSAQEG